VGSCSCDVSVDRHPSSLDYIPNVHHHHHHQNCPTSDNRDRILPSLKTNTLQYITLHTAYITYLFHSRQSEHTLAAHSTVAIRPPESLSITHLFRQHQLSALSPCHRPPITTENSNLAHKAGDSKKGEGVVDFNLPIYLKLGEATLAYQPAQEL